MTLTSRNYELIVALTEMLESEGTISTEQKNSIVRAAAPEHAQETRVRAAEGRGPPEWAKAEGGAPR